MLDSRDQFEKEPAFAPVETKRASQVIYEQILDMIVSGKLKEGDRLPSEKNLMDMLKRSRPTVREALRMLERSGYIRTIPGSNGAIIQKPGIESLLEPMDSLIRISCISAEEMVEYREINDTRMARWAAERHTEEDLVAMEELLNRAETLLADYSAFVKLDPEFHALIAKAAKNEVAHIITYVLGDCITRTVLQQEEKMSEQGRIAMNEKVLWMHRYLVNAIASGNPDEAEKAMRFHLAALRKDLLQDNTKSENPPAVMEA